MREGCIEEIIQNYLLEKITEDIKDEFVNAAIHFNINEKVYDTYGNLKVECMLNNIKSEEVINHVELCSTYGYILFRAIKNNELDNEDIIEALQIILSIKNALTRYVTRTIDEMELYERLKVTIHKMNLSDEYNYKILSLI